MHIENELIAEQLAYDVADERAQAETDHAKMNQEQAEAFEKICKSVRDRQGKIFFLNGPGGTGKTFVYNTICHMLRGEGFIVLCVASSGIAALLLTGGRTAHFAFKIPVEGLNEESICSILKESQRAALLRMTRLIIWDEMTMQHRNAAEAVDRTLRDICDNDVLFGGITVVFGGDYQQILPVVPKGSPEDIVAATLQRSSIWQHVEVLRLTQNMRLDQSNEAQEFARWLLDVGHGRGLSAERKVSLPQEMVTGDIDNLIDTIYPAIAIDRPIPPPDYFLQRTILAARNSDVDDINRKVLDRMPGEQQIFVSADSIAREAGADGDLNEAVPVEYLRSLEASGLPPGELCLKPGCPLILLRNLSPANGLCNGSRMVLLRATGRVLETRIIGGDHNGEIALIPRITLTPSARNAGFPFVLKRRQFPVRLAFAISINKAQGQSITNVGIDLRVPVFSHGQLYVALSRATSKSSVKVLLPPEELRTCTTPNVVYPQVLLD